MVKDLSSQEWETTVLASEKPVLVEFWYRDCVWCQRLKPIYEELEKEYPQLAFTRLNILENEENHGISEKYGVMGTPTIKVFCGGIETGELVGFMPKEDFRVRLDAIIKASAECTKSTTSLRH